MCIPKEVRTIEKSAFASCHNLTGFGCFEGIKSIGEGVLSDCPYLGAVSIPDGVVVMGRHVFHGCVRLQKIELPALRSWSFAVARIHERNGVD